MKTLEVDDGRIELRAVTGPDYGRIWDHELVAAGMKIADEGTGETRWKMPGLLDWSTMTHNPFVEVTKDTTTMPPIAMYSSFWSTTLTRSKLAACPTVTPTSTSAASIAGTARWAPRPSAWRPTSAPPA